MTNSDNSSLQKVLSACKPGDIISIPGNTVKEPLINKLPLTWIALYAAAVG
jgi:hypothetical protein